METVERAKPHVPTRRRLTVREFLRMDEVGLFGPEERVELIDGEIIDMASIGSRHGSGVKRLIEVSRDAVGKRATVAAQDPLYLSEHSMPQPDIMILKRRDDFYARAHPSAADVLLVIEVADSSARYDREIKLPLYARHGVPEVWIADLDARLVRFFRKPQGDVCTDITVIETPGPTPVAAPEGVVIDLTGVLG